MFVNHSSYTCQHMMFVFVILCMNIGALQAGEYGTGWYLMLLDVLVSSECMVPRSALVRNSCKVFVWHPVIFTSHTGIEVYDSMI